MSPTHQDFSNDTTFSQIKSSVPVPLKSVKVLILKVYSKTLSKYIFVYFLTANKYIK